MTQQQNLHPDSAPSNQMQALAPLRLPLGQNALIEASAGTGKTYTITTLYLRALLGLSQGLQGAPLTPLSIDQILVVTFTEAATQEIKDRVRSKLQEAQGALISGEAGDPNLAQLLAEFRASFIKQYPESNDAAADLYAYHRLEDAITLIDEASIFTIHGFCHRCLKQFAFETNSSFEQHFEMDAKPILLGALQDFWRKRVSELTGHEFDWFKQFWTNPDSLYAAIAEVIGKRVHIKPNTAESAYQSLLQQHKALISEVKQGWIEQGFASAVSQSGIKKTTKSYKQLNKVNDFVQTELTLLPFAKGDGWHLWSSETLTKASNFGKGSEPFAHPLLKTLDALAEVEHRLKAGAFQAHWLEQAKTYIESRAGQLKTEDQIINPDDLLTELLAAIEGDAEGALVKAIRGRYPLAFIDEFQDTDPVQYGIFSTVYGEQNPVEPEEEGEDIDSLDDDEILTTSAPESAAMILIGDPKQAIYKFRGADIFTYIKAKQDIPASQHYTLIKNYRSHPALIKAVNQCFSLTPDSFQHQQIPFIQVGAGKSSTVSLQTAHGTSSNLALWHLLPEPQEGTEKAKTGFVKGEAEGLFAKWCAADIATQLADAEAGTLTIKGKKVKPQDICVLVRNRHQASLVKNALSELGVSAVFISRDNVFKTPLAQDLLRVLIALESPFNELKVRAASASLLFAAQVDELIQLNRDSAQWQQRLDLFVQAHELWAKGKVASALHLLINTVSTLHKWQQQSDLDADRLITDLRHLIELLQLQAVRKAGSQKLLLWFEQQVMASDNWEQASEEQQLRLESDNDLVQIATLHASKGLEYPIVYLPFVTEYKAAQKAIYHSNAEEAKGLSYQVDNQGIAMQVAEHERLAEDLRLLYVAMTRPIYKLVLGLVNLQAPRTKKSELAATALGQLLFKEQIDAELHLDNDVIEQVCLQVQHLVQQQTEEETVSYLAKTEDQVFQQYKSMAKHRVNQTNSSPVELAFTPFTGKVDSHWRMLSYSALAASHHHHTDTDHWLAGVSDESPNEQLSSEPNEEINTVFSFPKGANAGSCLHWILENLDFTQAVDEQIEAVEIGLDRYGIGEQWQALTAAWMQDVLDTNIAVAGHTFALNQVADQDKLVEMEFYFNFNQLSPAILRNALLMSGIEQDQFNFALFEQQQSLSGVLKGFIDLTLTVNGKYYVLDYKSNHLGNEAADYQNEKMANAMADHNYQLQALIYTLALHRWLQQRLPSYDYDQHIGGALYLFLRGMQGKDQEQDTGVYTLSFKREVIEYLDSELDKPVLQVDRGEQSEQTIQTSKEPALGAGLKSNKKAVEPAFKSDSQMGFDFE